jgi:hypothetical protein
MRSPFPGVDPYVEAGSVWVELHNPLMMYARDALQPILPPDYVARLELRIYIQSDSTTRPPGPRIPDLEIVRSPREPRPFRGGGGAAVLERPAAAESGGYWVAAPPVQQREAYVAIRLASSGELVTCVELLSPSNKQPGVGRREYLDKQRELILARINLVEVDLLRAGQHAVAVPEPEMAPADYKASIFRSAMPTGYWVLPWAVRDPIPPIPIPLAPDDDELTLDLQALFARAYENAACWKLVDYRRDAEPPLRPDDAAWADALLRAAGLRGDPVAG